MTFGQSKDCPSFYQSENSMPIYQYKNEETGEVSDKFMSIADMEQFEIDNPHIKKIIHAAAFAAPERMSIPGVKKTDDNFNDLLKTMKKGNPGSDIKTR